MFFSLYLVYFYVLLLSIGYHNAHNALFFADYSGRKFDPLSMYVAEEITPEVAAESARVKSLREESIAAQEALNKNIGKYNSEHDKLNETQRKQRFDMIVKEREAVVALRQLFEDTYTKFKSNTNLPFNPYPTEWSSPEYADDIESVPTYAYLAPNPAWDGVGCAVLNGPSTFDETMLNIGESLQRILCLPSGIIHKRVGSIHEPVGGMKEMEVSYKYDDFRRTSLDLTPAHKFLLPHQMDEVLYKDWKERGEKLFHYVPINSGPKNMEEVGREYMESGATMHAKALMNVFDPIAVLPASKANKLIKNRAHTKDMDALVRKFRAENEGMLSDLHETSAPIEKIQKIGGYGNTLPF